MTGPGSADADLQVVRRRLVELRRVLGYLEQDVGTSSAELAVDWRRRLALQKAVEVLVELATGINTRAVLSVGGVPTETYRGSFLSAAEHGVIPEELAVTLAPAGSLRNVLTHRYVELDLDVFAAALPRLARDVRRYADAVGAWLVGRQRPDDDDGPPSTTR